MKRVSIFNCVSTAYEMLRFSSDAILKNAGTDNFDYIIVKWLANEQVSNYLLKLEQKHDNVHIIEYKTNSSIGYVPNLRGMMNLGFNHGYTLNDYNGLTNTDMYFGKDWLVNLVKYATPETIVNATHITPIKGPHVITANLGIPEYATFNMNRFDELYQEFYDDRLSHEDARGGWKVTNTMPYLIPRKYWEVAGPWEFNITDNQTPDRRFFQRCSDAGAKFTMSHSSIVYHHEAVERRRSRPKGAENLSNDA